MQMLTRKSSALQLYRSYSTSIPHFWYTRVTLLVSEAEHWHPLQLPLVTRTLWYHRRTVNH